VAADGERDKFFEAKEALAYGLVDEVAEFPANKGIKNTDSK
ncbi:MAG: ATP-dependent Clp protease proteolytic subunit, partial [Planctomycetota bacterium]